MRELGECTYVRRRSINAIVDRIEVGMVLIEIRGPVMFFEWLENSWEVNFGALYMLLADGFRSSIRLIYCKSFCG